MIAKLLKLVLGFAVLFCFSAVTVYAQTGTITGQVTDQQTGESLINANVFIQELSAGAATNTSGQYSIEDVPYGTYQLRVSYVGYDTQTVTVTVDEATETVDVALKSSTGQLTELVITGFGVRRQVNELSYSAQQLDVEELSKSGTADIFSSLQGKVAGVQISSKNGLGASSDIILRGVNSLTGNNQVLFVVDGIPIANKRFNTEDQEAGYAGYDFGSTGLDLSSANIASVKVLKGAAATALYGSRASNGVIIITTKKGKPQNESVNIVFNTSIGVSKVNPNTFPTYQKKYGAGYSPGFLTKANTWTSNPTDSITTSKFTADASFGSRFDPDKMVYQWDSFYRGSPTFQEKTPWTVADNMPIEFFETGTNVKNSLFVRGGINDGGGFYSLGYSQNNIRGTIPNSSLDKYSLKFSGGYDISEALRVAASFDYTRTEGLGRPARGYSTIMSSFRQWWETNVDVLKQKRAYFRDHNNTTWNPTATRSGPFYWNNPYYERYENYETDQRDRYFSYAKIQYDATDWLIFMGRVSYSGFHQLIEERLAVGSVAVGKYNGASGYQRRSIDYSEFNFRFQANYNTNISQDVTLSGVVGVNARRTHTLSVASITSGGLITPGIYSLDNSVNNVPFPDERDQQLGVNGLFASAKLGYNNYLFLVLNGRRDKASSLPEDNNVYYYGSVSGSFLFGKLVDADWLSFGKIRASVGRVGNQAPPLSLRDVYTRNPNFQGAGLFTIPTTKNNPNLKPEITKSWQIGAQLGFFNDRIYLDVTYYSENTFNQVFRAPISTATGYTSKYVNAGELSNKGVEVVLRTRPIVSENFSWEMTINWSKNENKVVDLGGGIVYFEMVDPQGGVSIGAYEGDPIGVLRGSDFTYTDNGRRIVNEDGYYVLSDPNTILGDMNPDWTGGISNKLSYKNWSLNVLVDVQYGGQIFSLDQWYGQGTGLYPNTVGINPKGNSIRMPVDEGGGVLNKGVVNVGTEENPEWVENTTYVSANTAFGYNSMPQSAYVYDATYVKLREIGITYNLPVSVTEAIGVLDQASISLVGRNLWIIYKELPYADPEATLSGGNVGGYSGGSYPALRTVSLNIELNF